MSDLSPKDTDESDIIFFSVIACAALVLFLVPSLIAMIIFYVFRGKLKKVEILSLFVASSALLIFVSFHNAKTYVQWLMSFFSEQAVNKGDVPYLFIFNVSIVLALLMLLLVNTKIGGYIPNISGGMFSKPVEVSSGVLPTTEEKINTKKIVSVPGSTLTIDSNKHTLESKEVGDRDFPVGLDKANKPMFINESEIRTHGLIFGSTGSGKTELIKTIAGGLMDLGWSGMILDLKEDTATGGLMDWCESYCNNNALPFQEFALSNPDPQYWFSPLKGIGSDEALNTILASQKFEDAYYRSLNEKQLGQLVTLLYSCNKIDPEKYPHPTVYEIGNILSASDLREATKEMVALLLREIPSFEKKDFDTLINPSKIMQETAGGLGARLTAMYQTQVGRVALKPGNNRMEMDVTNSGLTYVGLDSLGKGEITRLVSAAVLRRMAVYAADRTSGKERGASQGQKDFRFLIVDEANFVDRFILLELLSRARSAGIACILCTQGPTDWISRGKGEPDLSSLVQNTNVAFIMSQGERSNAELCADIIGRANRSDYTARVDVLGEVTESGSMRSVVDFIVSPDDLRGMGVGEVVVRIGKPQEKQFWFQAQRRNPQDRVKK